MQHLQQAACSALSLCLCPVALHVLKPHGKESIYIIVITLCDCPSHVQGKRDDAQHVVIVIARVMFRAREKMHSRPDATLS